MSAGAAAAEAPAGGRRLNLVASLRRARWAALLAVAFAVYFAADRYMDLPPTGDQPHYELEAYSLWLDGDRDLRNDYSDPSRTSQLFGPAVPDLHAHRYTKSPALYSVHNVGLPLLLVPGAALGRHTTYWFHVELVLIAALAALVLLSILEELRLARPVWTYLVWAAIAFSAPLVVFAGQAFPELAGALFALLGIRALVSRPLRRRNVFLGSVAASFLPWLHVRFTLISVMIVALLAVRSVSGLTDRPRGVSSAFRREQLRTTLRRAAWAVAPLLISLGAMAIEFQRWYGSPLLNAQYQGGQPSFFSNPRFTYFWFLGGLFSSDHGWVPLAPVAALGIAGIGFFCWRYGRWALVGTVLTIIYLLFANSGGNEVAGGFTPGFSFYWRYHLIVIPLVAIPLLAAVAGVWILRIAVLPLIAVTLLLSVQAVYHPLVLLFGQTALHLHQIPLMIRLGPVWPYFAIPGRNYPSVGHLAAVLFVLALIGALLIPARDRRTVGGISRAA